MEPNIHLHHSCLLLLTPTNRGYPKFLFSPSYFCLILTNWLLVLPVSGTGSSSSWRQESQSQTQQGCLDELACGSIPFSYLNFMC